MPLKGRLEFITRHALPLAMVLLYLPQSLVVWYLLDDEIAKLLFYLVLGAVCFIYAGYAAAMRLEGRHKISFRLYTPPVTALYAVFVVVALYLIATSQNALWMSINGASFEAVAQARESFSKYRSGGEVIVMYLYALLLRSAVPMGLVWLFAQRSRWRFLVLGLTIGLLMLSLEKMLPALVLMPLVAYYWLHMQLKKAVYIGCLLLAVFFTATYFSTIRPQVSPEIQLQLQSEQRSNKIETSQPVRPRKVELPTSVYEPLVFLKKENFIIEFNVVNGMNPTKRNFKPHNTFTKMLERALWTPFATAYDWLHLWKTHYGEYMKGRTIGIIAKLTGRQKINFDKEVHYYQYWTNGDANALFVADAYINFGFVAVAIYSFLIGFFMGLVRLSGSIEFISVSIIYAYALSISALPPNLLSGGIGVFVLLLLISMLTVKMKSVQTQDGFDAT